LRPNSEVVSRKLGDRLVVVNLRTSRIYELNRTASRLWELLEAGSDRTEVEDALVEEFDAERSVVSRDVDQTIAKLSAEGLIVERQAA
jgi:Coenzyme PQQ synthesis protein D (PqqD)